MNTAPGQLKWKKNINKIVKNDKKKLNIIKKMRKKNTKWKCKKTRIKLKKDKKM